MDVYFGQRPCDRGKSQKTPSRKPRPTPPGNHRSLHGPTSARDACRPSTMPSRIALLIAGALPDHLQATHGDYTAVFTAFLRASLAPHQQHDFELVPYDVVHKMHYPTDDELATYDAVMYTGSASNAYDDIEWINTLVAFTARIIDAHPTLKLIGASLSFRVIPHAPPNPPPQKGICFGHQIIARALGGSCVRNTAWEVGPTPLHLTPLGKSLFAVHSLTIQQMHRDHVPVLPSSNLHLLASTPTSPIQGFVRFFPTASPSSPPSQIHILSLQFHPEFTEPIVSHLISIRAQSGIIPSDVASDYAQRRKQWPNDGVSVVGKAVWAVLGVAGV
ncbi:hypothetical protein C0995_016621 [Termitomyces sp. Mi166|nr:hypothetical protein C0995_016621 [Termitomyces sp. Mi166\